MWPTQAVACTNLLHADAQLSASGLSWLQPQLFPLCLYLSIQLCQVSIQVVDVAVNERVYLAGYVDLHAKEEPKCTEGE